MFGRQTFLSVSTPQARAVVRAVLATAPNEAGLSTREIYQASLTQFPDAVDHSLPRTRSGGIRGLATNMPHPPFPDHPIRSVRFLKKFVLEDMAERKQIEKVHVKRGKIDGSGNHVDTVVSKTEGLLAVSNAITLRDAWTWRLVKTEEKSDNGDDPPYADADLDGLGGRKANYTISWGSQTEGESGKGDKAPHDGDDGGRGSGKADYTISWGPKPSRSKLGTIPRQKRR